MNFWQGFTKKASEMLKWNALGGIEPATPETIERAQLVELKTLAQDVDGANCSNCKWSRPLPDESFLCNNPEIVQEVTERMLCAKWENPGSIFAGSGEDKAKELQQDQAMAESSEDGQNAQMDQVGQELGLDDEQQASAADSGDQQGSAPVGMPQENAGGEPKPVPDAEQATEGSVNKTEAKPKAKPKKKDEKGGANTIHINVGGEKKASAMRGFLNG